MNNTLFLTIVAVSLVSLVSLIGVSYFVVAEKSLRRFIPWLVAFAAGALLGTSFFDLIPESIELIPNTYPIYVVGGIILFLLLEQFLHWHHDHDEDCNHIHPTGYSVLIGDGMHNFLDGVLIGSSFLVSPTVGWGTTLAVVLHEIPQELSDFAVLLHSGFSKSRALFFNFISSLTAILGALSAYFFLSKIEAFLPYIVAIGAGGFLYISLVDLFAEVKVGEGFATRFGKVALVMLGLTTLYVVGKYLGHE